MCILLKSPGRYLLRDQYERLKKASMMPCRVWVEFWCQVYPSSNIHPANLCKALVFTFRPWHLLQKPRFYQNRSKSSAKYAQDSEAHFARELSGLTASTAVETSPPPLSWRYGIVSPQSFEFPTVASVLGEVVQSRPFCTHASPGVSWNGLGGLPELLEQHTL